MAKVTGPLLSLDASGSVASTIVFSRWKGVQYARQRVVPTYRRTNDQAAIRDLIKDASQAWRNEDTPIDSSYKEAYDAAASGQAYSGFNLFIRDAVGKNQGTLYDGNFVAPTEPGDNSPA